VFGFGGKKESLGMAVAYTKENSTHEKKKEKPQLQRFNYEEIYNTHTCWQLWRKN